MRGKMREGFVLEVTDDNLDIEEFIRVNDFEENDPVMAGLLRALKVGERISGGGGAAPFWEVERVEDCPVCDGDPGDGSHCERCAEDAAAR